MYPLTAVACNAYYAPLTQNRGASGHQSKIYWNRSGIRLATGRCRPGRNARPAPSPAALAGGLDARAQDGLGRPNVSPGRGRSSPLHRRPEDQAGRHRGDPGPGAGARAQGRASARPARRPICEEGRHVSEARIVCEGASRRRSLIVAEASPFTKDRYAREGVALTIEKVLGVE